MKNAVAVLSSMFAMATLNACGRSRSLPEAHGMPEASVPICDGSGSLRLRLFLAPANDRELAGSIVRVENGYPSFAVDGGCSYWMNSWDGADVLARDRPWRVGQLPAELRAILESSVDLENLQDLDDCEAPSSASDLSQAMITSPTSYATCIGSGVVFGRVWQLIDSRAAALWAAASPLVDTGIHVSATEVSDGDPKRKEYAWPLSSQRLANFYLDATDNDLSQAGVSRLVLPPEASALVQLRNTYLADRIATPGLFGDGMIVNDGSKRATIYMRDALPYEDSHGLLPLSGGR